MEPSFATDGKVARRCWYQLHRSTYAMLMAASCAFILIAVPGQVTVHDGCWNERWNKYEHG